MLIWPLAQTLRYCGFEVLQPVAAHGVHGYHEGAAELALRDHLKDVLDAQASLIERFDHLPRIPFNPDSDFDEDGRLRDTAPVYSPFICPDR